MKSEAMGGTYSLLAEASSLVAWTADLLLRQSGAGFAIKFLGKRMRGSGNGKNGSRILGERIFNRKLEAIYILLF